MKVTVSENSVLHDGKTYFKGETIDCSDEDSQRLVTAGVAFITEDVSEKTDTDSADTKQESEVTKTGGSKKGK